MIKVLDVYIIKQFIKNFLFGILSFVLIFILVDLFENLDKFIDNNLKIEAIFTYYIYFIPEILKLITPVAMLLATLFTVSRFNTYSEMVAINSSGVSLFRFSYPLLFFGILITVFSVYFNGWIVPKSNSLKLNFERTYLKKNLIAGNIQNLHIQDAENRILAMGNYNESEKTGLNISYQIFKKDSPSVMTKRFDIKKMIWDSLRSEWKLHNILEREFDSANSEIIVFFDSAYVSEIADIGKIYISPSQIIRKQMKPDEIMLPDLKEFINAMEESGQTVLRAKVDYYSKISFPFANIITILFGISYNSHKRKGSTALQFGISILITFIYLGFVKISQTFGYNGDISPLLTAWMANIVFFLISILLLFRGKFFKSIS